VTKSEIKELAVDCVCDKLISDVLIDLSLDSKEELLHLDYDKYELIRKVVRLTTKNIESKTA